MNNLRLSLALVVVTFPLVMAGCETPAPTGGSPAGNAGVGGSAGGAKLQIAMMPKKKAIDYFNACERGGREAAAELGDVEFIYDGPEVDRSEDQSQLIDSWIIKGYDVICIACNDQYQIAPALKRAKDAGIPVITYDSDADAGPSGREFFVNQASVEAIAQTLVDEMARQVGENADVAYLSSSKTAPNQSAWIAAMEPYLAERYPGLKVVTTQYAQEDQAMSVEKTENILKAYPNVKGIWGMTSVAFPSAADAVRRAGRSADVKVVGLSTPNAMREYVRDGTVENVVLWNPIDLGYLAVYVAHAVGRGELSAGASKFVAGRLGELVVNGDQVMLGKPFIFDQSNIDEFDF